VATDDDLTAIVLGWNLPDHTIRCVEALVADGLPPGRIVIVENGPRPETWDAVTAALPAGVLVRLDQNVGFARANNIGAQVLPGSAYLFVNNDAFVRRAGSIASLVAALRRPRVGIVVPRLLNEDVSLQPTVAPFTTPSVALVRASGLSRLIPNRWQPKWSTHWDHGSSREIEAAIGAVMLVSAEAWEATGGFRETSFMYAEDLDLCWHARELGFTAWFEANAEFTHLGGASSDKRWSSLERGEQVGKAEADMIRRHLSPRRAAAALAFTRVGLAARVLCFGAAGRAAAAASCRGYLRGFGAPVVRTDDPGPNPEVEVVRPAA
jgi:N-acetylglucosaminyl-diphospho-decaprenol L-rhamnosyltransferase